MRRAYLIPACAIALTGLTAATQDVVQLPLPRAGGQGMSDTAESPRPKAADYIRSLSRQLQPHWQMPEGEGAEALATRVTWTMDEDGNFEVAPTVVSQSGVTEANAALAPLHAERALRAVEQAAPFDLPPNLPPAWRRVTYVFNQRTS